MHFCDVCGLRHNPDSDLVQLENRIRLGEVDLVSDYCQYREGIGNPLNLWDLISLTSEKILVLPAPRHFSSAWDQIRNEGKFHVTIYPLDPWAGYDSYQIMIPGYGDSAQNYLPAAVASAFRLLKAAKYSRPHPLIQGWLAPRSTDATLIMTERTRRKIAEFKITCDAAPSILHHNHIDLKFWSFIFE